MDIKGNKKVITAWTFYDWANSVYNLVITATIFPIYYKSVTETKLTDGTLINTVSFLGIQLKNTTLYDLSLAFAYLLIVILAPILSGIADYGGNKKRFMQFFCYMGALACSCMYFFDSSNVYLGVVLAIFACMGWAGSLVFYNAFLPEIAEPKDHDRVSARGFAMGYFGSALLLIANLVMIMSQETGEEKLQMMRYSFLGVGLWWILFSQITFRYLPGKSIQKQRKGNSITKGYQELQKVWNQLKHHKQLPKFLISFFVYSMGVQTVMLVANHFGAEEIKMEAGQLITTILIIQFVALIGSFLFSYLSGKKGNIFTLKIATLIWALICLVTFLFVHSSGEFMVVAGFVGLVMGGIQSLSRSTYSKMLPETDDNASFFSFYDVTEKLSIVFGMATFGIINEFSPSMREPIVALIGFFAIGFFLLMRIPKESKSNQ